MGSLSFVAELKKHIVDVLDDAYSLGMYATDASHYQIMPIAVILPKDESEVKKAVEIARNYKIKIPAPWSRYKPCGSSSRGSIDN
jgi:FAD/FMN-containing dehydrogenases